MFDKIKSNFKEAFFGISLFFKCKCYSNQLIGKTGKEKVPRNIYGNLTDLKGFVKKQNRIHVWWKYLLIYPGLSLMKNVLGKHLVKESSKTPEYKNLRLFDEVFEESIVDWIKFFRLNLANHDGSLPRRTLKKFKMLMTENAANVLRLIKRMAITLLQNDTAYFEFFNIFAYNFARKICAAYNGKVDHVLYACRNINDVRYFVCVGEMPIEVKNQLLNIFSQGKVKLEIVGRKEWAKIKKKEKKN